MNDRPCKVCIWNVNGECSTWDCQPVIRREEAYRHTKGDKIRSMRDDELADWLTKIELRILEKKPTMSAEAIKEDWLVFLGEEADT